MRGRNSSSKRNEDRDHKEVLTFTLRSDEEHVRALIMHAVNTMASSFEPNAHPYVLSKLFTGLHAKVILHNSLLDSITAGKKSGRELCLAHFNRVNFYSPIYTCHADGTM